jgi:hypothetical protein
MDLTSATTPGATPMPPSLRIRRLCDRLHFLADVLDKVHGAPASPSALEEYIVRIEASALLLEHHLDEQARLAATLLSTSQTLRSDHLPHPGMMGRGPRRPASRGVRPSCRTTGVPLKSPSSAADSAPDTTPQETRPSADASP